MVASVRYLRYLLVSTAIGLVVVVVAGCTGTDPDNVSSPTAARPDPSDLTALTTTTLAGGRTDTDLQGLGLTPDQSSCLLRSDIDRAVDVTLAPEVDGPIQVVVSDDVTVTLPAGLRTGEQVWGEVLAVFADSCLSGDELTQVARALGSSDDELAVADDLPSMIDARRGAGFEPGELDCVDQALRAAPARISSLAADHRVGDERCVAPERLGVLRRGSLRNRLLLLGATEDEAGCLVATPAAIAALDEAAAVLAAGDGGGTGDITSPCLAPDRLSNLALLVTVNDVSLTADFG